MLRAGVFLWDAMPERQLRKTVEAVERATGPLCRGYDESDAIGLIAAIGNCDAFVAPALAYRHTPEQEAARRRFHQVCLDISSAIRRAIGYPGRPEHERRVVDLACDLQTAVKALCDVFGWHGVVPPKEDGQGARP
jgi:hypothetical protein